MAGISTVMDGALAYHDRRARNTMVSRKAILPLGGADTFGNPPLLGHFLREHQEPYFDEAHCQDYAIAFEARLEGIDLPRCAPRRHEKSDT